MKIYKLRHDKRAMMFNMLVGAAMAIIILFALLNIGSYINGTIGNELVETMPANVAGDWRSTLENRTYNTLLNTSAGYDDTVDIVVVSAIITAITIPLAAVVAVKRLF